MKILNCSVVLLVVALFALPVVADEPDRELVERFLEVTLAGEQYEFGLVAGFDMMAANEDVLESFPEEMRENYRKGMEEVKALLLEKMGWETVKEDVVALAREIYTTAELEAAIEAFDTPVMQEFLKKQVSMTQKMMGFSQEKVVELMPEIERIMEQAMSQ